MRRFNFSHFQKPTDEIENKRISYFTNATLLVTISLLSILSIIRIVLLQNTNLADYILWTLIGILLIIYLVFKKGKVNLAGLLFVITCWSAMTVLAWTFEGVRDIAIVAYILSILVAMLITKPWQALAISFLSIISLWVIFYAEHNHIIIPKIDTSFNYSIEFTVILILVIVLMYLTSKSFSASYGRIQKELEERKQAEEALNKSEEKIRTTEEKFSKLFYSSPDAIIVTELKSGRILEVNKSFEKFSGFSSEELIGHSVLELNMYEPAERQRFVTMLQERGNIHDVEFVLNNKAGKELQVLSSAEIIEIEGNLHTITILKDITERKLAEDILRASEEKHRELIENLNDVVFTLNTDGVITFISSQVSQLYNYTPNELVGHPFAELIHPDDLISLKAGFRDTLNRHLEPREFRYMTKDGQVRWALTSSRPIVENGKVVGINGLFSDITRRKIDEAALVESKALLTSIINSTNDLIWSVDVDRYNLLTFNKGLKEFFERAGIHIKEGMLLEDILPSELVHKLSQLYEQTLQESSVITMYQTTINDSTLWINLHLLSRGNKPYAISAFAKDITELMHAQEALIHAKEKAEESDRLKTAFMNNISHEVRTPLNGILGFAQFVLQPDIPENEKSYYLEVLSTSSERLLNTITDYMDISLIVSGNMQVNKQPILLSRLLNEIYDKFQTKCRAKNLKFIKQIPSEKSDCSVQFDASLLEKSISHLVDNAIKFTQTGSVILGFQFKDNEYEIFVKDTGSGIDAEAQEKIFDYFMQGEVSSTRGYEGSGLGLSIAKGLVVLMGGKIRIESIKGQGSIFSIVLPVEIDIISSGDFSNPKKTHRSSKISPLVLLVDDDEISVSFHKIILEKASYKYLIVKNGLEAVEICRDNPEISIVIMDIKMPIMDGLKATQKIREFRKDLPIIGVSAYALTGDMEKAINAGCDDYITKPVKSDSLLSTINKYL